MLKRCEYKHEELSYGGGNVCPGVRSRRSGRVTITLVIFEVS